MAYITTVMMGEKIARRILVAMFDTIRKKIRENRLAAALHDMDELPLSREHRSRLVNLHRRFRVYQDKAIGNLIEDRLLRIEENGIVEDLLMFLDMVEFPAKDQEIPESDTEGAAAGAGKEQRRKKSWLPLLLVGVVILALAVWWLLPAATPKPIGEATVERVEPSERPAAEQPSDQPATEEPEKNPERPTNPGTSRVPAGKLTINPELLQRPDLTRVKDLQLDPRVLSRTLLPALMTQGPQVDLAVAVYRNRKAPTKYDEALSKSLATYLDGQFKESITYGVLTDAFHDLEDRDRMVLRGAMEDNRLSSKRARYLLLVDIRNLTVTNKADFRLCLYDVARQKGLTKGSSVDLGSWTSIKQKDMSYQAKAFLTDRKERGLFQ